MQSWILFESATCFQIMYPSDSGKLPELDSFFFLEYVEETAS